MAIRRTTGRDGRIYYFDQRGRRLTERRGASRWVRENRESVNRDQLTQRERRSFDAGTRASRQFRYQGRFLPNPFGLFNRFLVLNQLPPDTRNLTNLFDSDDIRDLLNQNFTQDLVTWRNYVNSMWESYETRSGDLLDTYTIIRDYIRRGYRFEFICNGQVMVDNDGLEALSRYEQNAQEEFVRQRGNALENVEIVHRLTVNTGQMTIEIDCNDTTKQPRGGTP